MQQQQHADSAPAVASESTASADTAGVTASTLRALRRVQQDRQKAAKALQRLKPSSTTVLLLVRHGETDWNASHRLQGQLNPGLNATGQKQARQLAEYFLARQTTLLHQQQSAAAMTAAATDVPAESAGDGGVDGKRLLMPQQPLSAVWSSDLSRATQTAEAIACAIGLQVNTSPQLRERRLGVLQGLTRTEAIAQQPDAWRALCADPRAAHGVVHAATLKASGLENEDEMRARVSDEVQHIADQHPGQTVLVVTHGGCLHALHVHATQGQSPRRRSRNGQVHALAVQDSSWVVLHWDEDAPAASNEQQEGFGGGRTGG